MKEPGEVDAEILAEAAEDERVDREARRAKLLRKVQPTGYARGSVRAATGPDLSVYVDPDGYLMALTPEQALDLANGELL